MEKRLLYLTLGGSGENPHVGASYECDVPGARMVETEFF